jgi:hypothetical protein
MAAQVVAVLLANLVGLPGSDPVDVETDSTAAPLGSVNVFVPPAAGSGGFLTADQIAASVLAACANGPCSVIISQGSGTVTQAVSQ